MNRANCRSVEFLMNCSSLISIPFGPKMTLPTCCAHVASWRKYPDPKELLEDFDAKAAFHITWSEITSSPTHNHCVGKTSHKAYETYAGGISFVTSGTDPVGTKRGSTTGHKPTRSGQTYCDILVIRVRRISKVVPHNGE